MPLFRPASPTQIDMGLTLLRVVTGLVFVAHGAQKLFVYGFAGVAGGFGQMGVPLPGVAGPAVALVEFFGGLALIAGLLTRLAGVGLAAVMLGAMWFVHLAAGFFLPNGYEFTMLLGGAALALVLMGAGGLSADAAIGGREPARRT